MRFLLLFLLSWSAWGVDCSKHKIYCHIKRLKPRIDSKFAMSLSNLLYKYSKKYKINPHVSVAIIMQESSFRNKDRIVRAYVDRDGVEVPEYVVTDVSMYQFHVDTIENFKLDTERLRTDLEYATEQHFKLLAKKIKVCSNRGIGKNKAWACYHSYTRKHMNKYYKLVGRYL